MAKTEVATVEKKPLTFNDLLEKMKPQIAAILPKHLTPERMVALCALAATKTPQLKECTPLSLFNAIVHASRLGLEIGQHAHLVPFKNSKAGVTEVVMVPDYRGLISLAVRSGKVKHIDARAVYKDDAFDYQYGTQPLILHKPKLDAERGEKEMVAFYAAAHLVDGTVVFDVMSKAEVDGIRARSRAKDAGPWATDYEAMGKKTVVKRLAKFLPQTPELAAAIELDNRGETGEIGTVSAIIDSPESVNAAVAQETKAKLDTLKGKLDKDKQPAPPQADQTEAVPSGPPY